MSHIMLFIRNFYFNSTQSVMSLKSPFSSHSLQAVLVCGFECKCAPPLKTAPPYTMATLCLLHTRETQTKYVPWVGVCGYQFSMSRHQRLLRNQSYKQKHSFLTPIKSNCPSMDTRHVTTVSDT